MSEPSGQHSCKLCIFFPVDYTHRVTEGEKGEKNILWQGDCTSLEELVARSNSGQLLLRVYSLFHKVEPKHEMPGGEVPLLLQVTAGLPGTSCECSSDTLRRDEP